MKKLVDTIVGGLANTYMSFVQSWSTLEKNEQSLTELVGRLQYIETIIKKNRRKHESAFHVDSKSKDRKSKSNNSNQNHNETKTFTSWNKTGACLGCESTCHKLSPSCPKYDSNYKSKKNNKNNNDDKEQPQSSSKKRMIRKKNPLRSSL